MGQMEPMHRLDTLSSKSSNQISESKDMSESPSPSPAIENIDIEKLTEKEMTHNCVEYRYSTRDNQAFSRHNKHASEKLEGWLCTHPGCNKRFGRKVHMTRHLKIHSGIKPHQCMYCFKRFFRRSNMTA